MPALFVETEPPSPTPLRFSIDPQPLLALLSFGIAEPYGTQHPLTELIRRFKTGHGIDVGPLLTFYDRDTEDAEDVAKLAAAWQSAAALGECVGAMRRALREDNETAGFASVEPTLPQLLEELEAMAAGAGTGRIQISFSLTWGDRPGEGGEPAAADAENPAG
ncbi:MAG: hypothetical protein DK306_000784 [Chloroflexi bacterium]|nr:MAG: hypothetical protein DK306_000784 [Chloroflexota bacterium]